LSRFAEYYKAFIIGIKGWLTSKRFSIYLICVIIASLIWLLIKFSSEYNTQFPIAIELVNPPEGNWMIIDNKTEVVAEIYGFGFDLFSYKLFGFEEVSIDLSEFEVNDANDPAFIYISETFLSNMVNRSMKGNEKVISIFPGKLKVELSKAITKKVPIKLNVKVYPAKGFKIKGVPKLEPNNLDFFGPTSILSKIEYVNTETDTIDDIRLAQRTLVKLELDTIEKYLVGQVEDYLVVDVDELTSGSIEIKVDSEVDSKDMEIRVLPSKVKVYYQVGLSDFQKVSEKMFEAVIELPESGDMPEKLKVILSEVPDFVEIKRIEPLFVEYLIIKK
jgi:hypothetical protein